MLQLKYLLHDRDRALSILSRWNYDESQPALMERFRISSNAVYAFTHEGVIHFLRFAHEEEKSREQILAELEFLRYLNANGYPCLRPVVSKYGNEVEVVDTPAGRYYATVFLGVPGKSLGNQPITADMLYGWGKQMGLLHRLSKDYTPENYRRVDHEGKLKWMAEVLATFPDEKLARTELKIVNDWLAKLPRTKDHYGLIHYDFELDNVFYCEDTKKFHIIDFDDAAYHWFALDVTNALASYEGDNPHLALEQFIAGYRTEHVWDEQWLALMPGFTRYQLLYGYVRIIRSTQDKSFGEEPDWMAGLRQKLAKLCKERSANFGKEI
ncbi:MAG: hypothetical protein FD169_1213 [Bacillota bacterium]|nr:MAG: hypothetical protein FD169_1213 [Bacillota bacterium]